MAQVFISYAREDGAIARRLAAVLTADGCDVWWDEDLLAGRDFDQAIERELRDAKAAIVIWSPDSVISRWVRSEAAEAADRGVLVPITIRHAVAPIQFRIIQGIDMSNWNGQDDHPGLASLRRSLRSLGAMTAPAPAPVLAGLPVPPAPAPRPSASPAPATTSVGDVPAASGSPDRRRRLAVIVAGAVLVVAIAGAAIAAARQGGNGGSIATSAVGVTTTLDAAGALDPETATPDVAIDPVADCGLLLHRGCRSDSVRDLQQRLADLGLYDDFIDGDFGRKTEAALRAFEGLQGLDPDGTIDSSSQEWSLLAARADEANATTTIASTTATTAHSTGTTVRGSGTTGATVTTPTVPNVVGMTEAEARDVLMKVGYVVDVGADRTTFGGLHSGRVTTQTPKAASPLDKGKRVKIVVGQPLLVSATAVLTTN